MKLLQTTLLFAFLSANSFAQTDVYLSIKHMLGNVDFAYGQTTANDLSQDLNIDRVEYYMSSFIIIHDGGTETAVPLSTYVLAKGSADVDVNLGSYNVTAVEGIKFSIGVNAPTNNADPTLFSAPHPLAPQSPSMHWGWTAGYRFVALEGNAGSNMSTGFEMHGLGNTNYFGQTVMAPGETVGSDIYIKLEADYARALEGIDVASGPIDHGVDATDLTVLENFRDYVFAAEGARTSITQVQEAEETLSLYPNPSNGALNINYSTVDQLPSSIRVYNVNGTLVKNIEWNPAQMATINMDAKGVYFLQMDFENKNSLVQKFVIH